jgi:AraC-like DNA-binding protein
MHPIDIALEYGFSSHSHLSRAFRQILGVAARECHVEIL